MKHVNVKNNIVVSFLPFLWLLIMAVSLTGCRPEEDKQQELDYPQGLKQIHAEAFFEQNLTGNNIKIGILDFGFASMDEDPSLRHLRKDGQIVMIKDYTHGDSASLFKNIHGTKVLRYMAGIRPDDNIYRNNLASGARFYLFMVTRNFDKNSDERETEYVIDSALNDLFSLGVRVVNLSMGFWDEYSDDHENYHPEEMNGRTTVITKICEKWARRGMVIINSAGNTGEYSWKIIWAPSDAPDVISIGAARFPDKVFKASYSARGNPAIPYVKPDLIAFSPWGTSFSAPVITGIVACMLQKDSTLTLRQIRNILYRSSTLYPYPNNFVGYGIPDARKILVLLDHPGKDVSSVTRLSVKGRKITVPASSPNNVIFEKSTSYLVRKQYIDEAGDGNVTVTRKKGVAFTTIVLGERVLEICWE